MPIWRVYITKVEAKREDKIPRELKIEVIPRVGEASIEKAGEAKLIRVNFGLSAKYSNAAEINVEGFMHLIGEKEEIVEDDVIKDPNVLRAIYQRIFVEPMVIAINLAKELHLPLPVRMPEVRVAKKE